MKFVLFCKLPYSFAILKPLEDEILKRGFEVIWYLPEKLFEIFPYKDSDYTTDINILKEYQSDVIFVPGNEVPYFLRGIKTQIFHGLAGEKKGHFRIRDYFDLYLTQGPYFTNKFNQLSQKHKNFDVIQTGWCKLDSLYDITQETHLYKQMLLEDYGVKNIILYSPTFSPSLTSGMKMIECITNLSLEKNNLVIIKFHDKMDKDIINRYKEIKSARLIISDDKDITRLLQISDLMISDTSSVVYEFALLDKPVVTLNSKSENINWANLEDENEMQKVVSDILHGNDDFKARRENVISQYHPYKDGKSASRMIDAVCEYKKAYGVPSERKLSVLRKFKIWKEYRK